MSDLASWQPRNAFPRQSAKFELAVVLGVAVQAMTGAWQATGVRCTCLSWLVRRCHSQWRRPDFPLGMSRVIIANEDGKEQ